MLGVSTAMLGVSTAMLGRTTLGPRLDHAPLQFIFAFLHHEVVMLAFVQPHHFLSSLFARTPH